jgi:AraC family transcriptional regulator of adaptative response / DNA-3-methyladenine glycosylase II
VVQLDSSACYRALRTRDARFDGRFFTAVRSTGVYCRPICPAPTPKRANCLFVPCAAAAQEAGFRPCLRCRPEAAPGTPAWLGTSATVSRALRLIEAGGLDSAGVPELANRLGIGPRHLRRLFLEHLGASPQAVAHTRRLLFAKKLISETPLPMAQVAFAAGFASVRRFNSAVRASYGRSPRELRGRRPAPGRHSAACEIELRLPYRAPFDWEAVLRFLAPRAIPGVESVGDGVYCRSLSLGAVHGIAEVRQDPKAPQLLARLRLTGDAPLIGVAERLRACFDLRADPHSIAAELGRDPRLARRLAREPGLRVPGCFDGFELAVRVVLGQQVSLAAATRLAGRLVENFGKPLRLATADGQLGWVFPAPEALVEADAAALRIPAARAGAIRALARAVVRGDVQLAPCADPEAEREALQALPGIGPWTAEVIAMRALGEPDAFPAGDLGIRRALGEPGAPVSAKQAETLAEAWRPWRSYAALLLWSVPN